MKIFKKILKLSNNKGLTLIELLVSVGLISIVSLGVMSIIGNMQAEQNKAMLQNTLRSLKSQIEYLIRDPSAWSQTINYTHATFPYNSSARFNSLRSMSLVNITGFNYKSDATSEKIILFTSTGDPDEAFNLLGPADTSGNGFTIQGTKCTTFNITGNDLCPISYRLLVGYACPGSVNTCNNPQMRIVARLVYSPQSRSLLRFKTMLNEFSGSDIRNEADIRRYDVLIDKVSSQGNRSFSIASRFTSVSGADNCNDNGAGTCTLALTTHPLTSSVGWVNVSGSSSLVNLGAGANQNISFNEPGNYSCTITVPAFATGGFYADFFNSTTNTIVGQGSTVAGKWSQSSAVFEAKFSVSPSGINDRYIVRQRCDNNTPGTEIPLYPNSQNNCTLGKITGTGMGAGNVHSIVIVSCYKIETL